YQLHRGLRWGCCLGLSARASFRLGFLLRSNSAILPHQAYRRHFILPTQRVLDPPEKLRTLPCDLHDGVRIALGQLRAGVFRSLLHGSLVSGGVGEDCKLFPRVSHEFWPACRAGSCAPAAGSKTWSCTSGTAADRTPSVAARCARSACSDA